MRKSYTRGVVLVIADSLASFVHQHDEEFSKLKKERRPGRPASTREDLLRMKIAADEKERENGFCTPTPISTFNIQLMSYRSPRPHRCG